MKRWLRIAAALLAVLPTLFAQSPDPEFDALRASEARRYMSLARAMKSAAAIERVMDVTYYKLNISVAGAMSYLNGDVTANATVTVPVLNAIDYNLTNTMHVDSAFVDGVGSAFTSNASSIRITTPKTYRAGDKLTTRVYYHGQPGYSGFGSYTDKLRADDTRWIYTLSEPYGARDWWPCVDHPNDKADSADILITCEKSLTAVTSGKLTETLLNADGTKTFHWKHRYPIATYLIAANVGTYSSFSDWYKYSPTDSMEVVNYVLPGIDTSSRNYRANVALTPRMLSIFSALFGQYPFIREKYGHVEFGWSGGMEHQTLTSLGSKSFSEATIAHELAHQWFGDMITCRSWQDLWLNEGFAQYFEAVYREKQYGAADYAATIASRTNGAKNAAGSLFVTDTADVNNLFAGNRVYYKGAWVLHMLRHAVGDSLFFASIRAYANDPALMYGTASTSDLRAAFERTTKRDLGWFFNEWVYGSGYPRYHGQYSFVNTGTGYIAYVHVSQELRSALPAFFTMPIDIRFAAKGWDTTVTVWNASQSVTYPIQLSRWVDTVQLDPKNWILADKSMIPLVGVEAEQRPASFFLAQNFPNPFNPSSTIRFGVARDSRVTITLYDMLGRVAATVFNGEMAAGSYTVPLDARTLSSGVYLYRLTAEHGGSFYTDVKRCIVIK